MNPHQLKIYRKTLNLTQVELASEMGIKLAKLRNWEQGRNAISAEGATLIRLLVDRFNQLESVSDSGENYSINKRGK